MLAAFFAIGSALSYGISDFLGGLASRKRSVVDATTVTFATALVMLVIAVLLVGAQFTPEAIMSGVVAGVCNVIGMGAFYAALTIGPVSILSPAIAALQALVSVVAGLMLGERFGAFGWAGVVVALVSALLVGLPSRLGTVRVTRRGALLALVSGLGLGGAVVALDAAPTTSGQAPALAEIGTGVLALLVVQLFARAAPRVARAVAALDGPDHVAAAPRASRMPWWMFAVATGLLMGVANALIVAALHEGRLGIVGVLVGLYPVPTVLLAWIVLRERLAPHQLIGVVGAIGACVLLSLA